MIRSMNSVWILGYLVAVFFVLIALPHYVGAQESTSDLSATIRAEILSDPRTAGLSEAEIDAVVDLLTQEAQKQGITSQAIQWQPESTERFVAGETAAPAPECAGGFLCAMSEAFGFVGADTTIPFTLGAASMGLIWILAEMIHRRRHPFAMAAPAPTSSL